MPNFQLSVSFEFRSLCCVYNCAPALPSPVTSHQFSLFRYFPAQPGQFWLASDYTVTSMLQVFFTLSISAIGLSQSSGMAMDRNKAKDSAASILKILDNKPNIDSSSNEGCHFGNCERRHRVQSCQLQVPNQKRCPDLQRPEFIHSI